MTEPAPPLAGLRILELATGVAGPYGGRLLGMLGASVVKIEPPGGDPVRRQPVDKHPAGEPSALHVHLNAGKRLVSHDAVALVEALRWADAVIASGVGRDFEGGALDPARLDGSPLLVTTSAWGYDSRDPGSVSDELLVQAVSGTMSTTGDPDGPPLRLPGFQAQYMAGGYVAAAALAGLRRAGCRHIDVPWVVCIASGTEGGWSHHLHTDRRQPPAGAHQPEVFPSGALPCADGFVAGTVRPSDWVSQCQVYGRRDLIDDDRFRSRGRRARNRDELWEIIEPWYAAHGRAEIFATALDAGWALGMIQRGSDALSDPHLEARGFLSSVELPSGRTLRTPTRPWHAPGVGSRPTRLAAAGEDGAWFGEQVRRARPAPVTRAPLEGVRILELTQAWAGPFVGRLLAALGADVVKIESSRRPDGWRTPRRFGDLAPDVGRDPDELSLEISPNFNALNRNKRQCAIDLSREEGRAAFLELVSAADAVVANMTARVLPGLRLGYDELRKANDSIILIHMPALGASGPFKEAAGYGTIVEGMGGLGALFGAPEEGARISFTYYPDPVAGLHAAVAVLSMLEQRDRGGHGGEVDLSHQEALWLQLGEALVSAAAGRDVERMGNAVPGCATSGVYPVAEGRWIAVASSVPCDDLLADSATLECQELLALLRGRGARAVEVLHYAEARHTPELSPWIEKLRHPVTQERPYLRVPLRIDGEPLSSRGPSPTIDQHTREVLGEWLGWDDTRIDAALATGALGGAADPERLRSFYRTRSRP